MWMPGSGIAIKALKLDVEPVAGCQRPCQVSSWKYTLCTGGAIGVNELLELKESRIDASPPGFTITLLGNGVIVVVGGIGFACCSVITVTLLLLKLVT